MKRLAPLLVLALGLLAAPAMGQSAGTDSAGRSASPETSAPPPRADEGPGAGDDSSTSRRSEPPPPGAGTPSNPARPQPAPPPDPEEREEEEDGGDPYDFLWIDIAGAISYVDMRALSENNFYPEFVRLNGVGGAGSLGLGFRIAFLAAGIRGTLASYGDGFDVGTAIGEVTLMLPIPIVKPYLRAGFGFAWHGDSDFNAPENSQTTVFGWAFNAAIGIDIYLAHWFSIGGAFSFDLLNMNRQSINEPIDPSTAGMVEFTDPGDAVGVQARGQAGITFHL